jgi:hypothetical protein
MYNFHQIILALSLCISPSICGALQFDIQDEIADTVTINNVETQWRIGVNSSDSSVRTKCVEYLINACNKADPIISRRAISYLSTFSPADFSDATYQDLIRLLRDDHPLLSSVMKIVAYLQLRSAVPTLRELSNAETTSIRWAALIALARLRDESAVETIMKEVQRFPVDDDIVYYIFPDLIFTRNRELIALVVKAVYSDEELCYPPDAEQNLRIRCAYRIIEQLAPVIRDFPLKLDAYGDLVANDYYQALDSARKWLTKHPDFEIITDTF